MSLVSAFSDILPSATAAHYVQIMCQVLIRWALQHGTSVLPKSTSAERIKVHKHAQYCSLTKTAWCTFLRID